MTIPNWKALSIDAESLLLVLHKETVLDIEGGLNRALQLDYLEGLRQGNPMTKSQRSAVERLLQVITGKGSGRVPAPLRPDHVGYPLLELGSDG